MPVTTITITPQADTHPIGVGRESEELGVELEVGVELEAGRQVEAVGDVIDAKATYAIAIWTTMAREVAVEIPIATDTMAIIGTVLGIDHTVI